MSAEQKKIIRKSILESRSQLNPQERRVSELRILEQFERLDLITPYNTFLVYSSFGHEINTWPIIDYLYQHNKTVVFPKVNLTHKALALFVVKHKGFLTTGLWDILEPNEDVCDLISIKDIDFILVPGLAYDKEGYRIGYGGGYYDKLLGQQDCNAYTLSIAFDIQRVERIPFEPFDRPIHSLITEKKIYYFNHPSHG
ncbi:MAG: 5-formyltetrahydrofolate cyclo-ligase [Betaproteobacteria bacterium]|nr:5-formyltetrahydrofolate cyclo-ligase [Betaproteobacteria bacterium]